MSNSDELLLEIDRLRDRMSRLSAASLRINASLDLDTVLGEVVGGARVLTGSHGGLITTVDDSGHPPGLVSTGRLAVDITTVLGPGLLAPVQGQAVLRLARALTRPPARLPARTRSPRSA